MEICINKPMEVVWTHDDGTEEIIPVVLDPKNSYDKESIHNLEKGYVWVKRADGDWFAKYGETIVFNKLNGTDFPGYRKPAILRNVQEKIMEYTNFEPFTGGINFRSFPLNVRVVNNSGHIEQLKLTSARDVLAMQDVVVAIAFEKVDPLRVEAERLLKKVQNRVALADVTSVIVEVLREQGFEAKKVDVNPNLGRMPTWFLALLEDCGIFTSAHRMDVWNWYMDTHNSNTAAWRLPSNLARKLDNRLLSFRPWSGGGQLVITPLGHGLAVTNAKKVYWKWKDRDFTSSYGMGSHENNGGYKPNYAKRTITVTAKGVEIGCQKIPHMAFTRLAERLGWPDKDPYGGY